MSCRIGIIAACTPGGVIGRAGDLPWGRGAPTAADRVRFRRETMGHAVIVGRKTWETLPRLEGRTKLVLTRTRSQINRILSSAGAGDDLWPCATLWKAIAQAELMGHEFAWVIGGSEVYREAWPLAGVLDLTVFSWPDEGDARLPVTPDQVRADPGWRAESPGVCVAGPPGSTPPFVSYRFRRAAPPAGSP